MNGPHSRNDRPASYPLASANLMRGDLVVALLPGGRGAQTGDHKVALQRLIS